MKRENYPAAIFFQFVLKVLIWAKYFGLNLFYLQHNEMLFLDDHLQDEINLLQQKKGEKNIKKIKKTVFFFLVFIQNVTKGGDGRKEENFLVRN